MNTCISLQMLIDNWQTILPLALLATSEIMGLMPNSQAKGLSHLVLLMYQNTKAQKLVTYVEPPAPPVPPSTGSTPDQRRGD